MSAPRKLLYVGTEPCMAELHRQLRARHWEPVHARSLRAARVLLEQQSFGVALLVLEPGARPHAAELEACRQAHPLCEWVAVVPPGAMKSPSLRELVLNHCFDHHTHPADPAFLCRSLGHAFGRALLRAGDPADAAQTLGLVGASAATQQLRRLLRRAASSSAPMLVRGESGSGRHHFARALHACSPRAGGPWRVLHCSDPAPDLGGAFAAAAGGTLLLEEVTELPREAQARLLRLILEAAVLRAKLGPDHAGTPRLVATSAADLARVVAEGRFREDLYYRLDALSATVPPLRERPEDIAPLARHFLQHCAAARAGPGAGLSRAALAAMAAHAWPGNVRELRNRVERAVLLAQGGLIGPADLGLEPAAPPPVLDSLEAIRVEAERSAIAASLDRYRHNVSLAARGLGVSRMTLYRLMAKHSIGQHPKGPPGRAALRRR